MKRFMPRGLALAGILVIAASCSSSKTSAPDLVKPPAVAAIPAAGSAAVQAAPALPARGVGMPTDTVPLAQLYQQGKVDVLR
jgi:hypothetical protein